MKKIRITALGDSLTKGVVLTEKNRYSVLDNNYMDLIGNELDMYIENYGKFGCTVSSGNSIIERHGDKIATSDYTFIEYGGNDCDFDWMQIADAPWGEHNPKTTLDAFKKQFAQLVERVKELGSKPVIVSLPPIISDAYFGFFSRLMSQEQTDNVRTWLNGDIGIISRWHESYNRALFEVANKTRTGIIDITTPFDTFRGNLKSLYCADGIHPNAAGHKLIAESILNLYF